MKKMIVPLIFVLLLCLIPFSASADSGEMISQENACVLSFVPSEPPASSSSAPDSDSGPSCDYVPQLFLDVDSSHWAYDAIEYVGSYGLMQGMGGSNFNPAGKTTRAQLVAILYRLEGQPAISGTNTFSDVTAPWAKAPVEWAASRGIVNGKGGGRFDPNGSISRQEFAAILARYARYKGLEASGSAEALDGFLDAGTVASWALSDLCWAKEAGLITGKSTSDGRVLNPNGDADRAQTAVILQRFSGVLDTVPPPIPVDYEINGQTVFTLSIPGNWRNDFVMKGNGEEIPWISFYDKRNHEGPEAMGGRLFGIFLDTEKETDLPHYKNWGKIQYNGQEYTLRFFYPTDVQCGNTPELQNSYTSKYMQVNGIFDNGIQLAEGVSKIG